MCCHLDASGQGFSLVWARRLQGFDAEHQSKEWLISIEETNRTAGKSKRRQMCCHLLCQWTSVFIGIHDASRTLDVTSYGSWQAFQEAYV